MNERIKDLAEQASEWYEQNVSGKGISGEWETKFAELIVKECADYVRETYDHEAAESIAWSMEVKYGLHGDYV